MEKSKEYREGSKRRFVERVLRQASINPQADTGPSSITCLTQSAEGARLAQERILARGKKIAKEVLEVERGVAEKCRKKNPTTGWCYTSSPSLAVARLADPPIKGGLTDCVSELLRIAHTIPEDMYTLSEQPLSANSDIRKVRTLPSLPFNHFSVVL
jgi:hypothetical protein